TGWVELATDDAPLDVNRLASIPYLPLSVWENVRPDGRGKAEVRLALATGNEFQYDVAVRPAGAALGVPAAAVTLGDVHGVVRVHDGRVEVYGADDRPDATGTLAGGDVAVRGKWNFDAEPAVADPLVV